MRAACGKRARGGDLGGARSGPVAEGVGGQLDDRRVIAIADRNQRGDRRSNRAPMKCPHIVRGQRRQRRLGADRRVPVRMRAVKQFEKRAIGDRGRHVAELGQAMQPELAHAGEVGVAQRRPGDHVGEQLQCARGEAAEHGDAGDGRVRSDVGVELRAEPRERLVHLDRRAIAAAFVEHVGGERREAFLAGRIGGGAAADEQRERDQRHLGVVHGPDAQAVGQRRLFDRRKAERARRRRRRQAAAIDRHAADRDHETTAASNREPRAWSGPSARC